MSETNGRPLSRSRALSALALGLLLALNGCGLDKVDVPDLDGPSELGTGIRMTASPDIVTADGYSSSLIQVHVQDQNGSPAVGRQIFVAVADANGNTADIGELRSTSGSGLGTGLVLTTGANGIAQASYEAPPRTDFTANSSVLITARPVGTDFAGQVYRTVRIELRSAEPRYFPQVPPTTGLRCGFVVEPGAGPYRTNAVISLMSTSSSALGPIIRYEWFFGDGTKDDKPNIAKVFRFAGTFQALHVITDSQGNQAACGAFLSVIP
ncbi:MAG: PKD domain-containing protein [Vicinamibacteria bacterium]